jgi:hypothetical protein
MRMTNVPSSSRSTRRSLVLTQTIGSLGVPRKAFVCAAGLQIDAPLLSRREDGHYFFAACATNRQRVSVFVRNCRFVVFGLIHEFIVKVWVVMHAISVATWRAWRVFQEPLIGSRLAELAKHNVL